MNAHSLYTQTGNFSFGATLSFANVIGRSDFGFSGNASSMGFSFVSGKIFDWNENFVGVYDQLTSTIISGIVGVSTADYYINNKPVAFGITRPTGYFYQIYSGSQNQDLSFKNLIVRGDIPNYTIQPSSVFSTGDVSVPITITNNSSFPFRIFSGDINSSKFSFSSIPTGRVINTFALDFVPNGIFSVGLNQVPLKLYTNFGSISVNVLMSGKADPFSGLFMEIIGSPAIPANSTSQFAVHFVNSGTPISIIPYLEYVSGSGLQGINVLLSGIYDVTGNGLITGSGNVSGNAFITGKGFEPDNTLISGIINSGITSFQWATGLQFSPVSIISSGRGFGINYTGVGTGILNRIVSGHILNGSGFYHATGLFSGVPSGLYSAYPTGVVRATGAIYYNSPQPYDVLYVYDQSDGIVNGYDYTTIDELTTFLNAHHNYYVSASKVGSTIYLTGLLSGEAGNIPLAVESSNVGNMSVSYQTLLGGKSFGIGELLTPTGRFTGHLNQNIDGTGFYAQRLTGVLFQNTFVNAFYKTFRDTWDMQTGNLSSFIDYRQSGFLSHKDTYIYRNGKITSSLVETFYINILYTPIGTGIDIANLFVSGFNTNHSVNQLVTGIR